MTRAQSVASGPTRGLVHLGWVWLALLLGWLAALSVGPDPRPLGAPGWAVDGGRALGLGEPSARVAATVVLRACGLALLGGLVMLALQAFGVRKAIATALLAAPVLAVAALWTNYGYFPIGAQLQIAIPSAMLGVLAALALQRNVRAAASFVLLTGGLVGWGVAAGIDDDLDGMTRAVGRYVIASAQEIPDGDAGFASLLELAFGYAEDNSHGTDPVRPNQAAIIALGVILGDEHVAAVARRPLDREALPAAEALRARITVHGRADWSRHFWVSAALTTLADDSRSITVGLTKELMDSVPGGSGFSFADLAADAAGNAFAVAATRDEASARAMQRRILQGVRIEDFVPDISDFPEGLSQRQLETEYGGLGGDGTRRITDEIRRRIESGAGLQ